jgi:ribonuclease P protein component
VDTPASQSFDRNERLKSRKVIATLFKTGRSFVAYPLRVVWAVSHAGEHGCATLAVSASKRIFKTAVQRNRLKRQMREAYRLHKQAFYEQLQPHHKHISLMITYIAKEPLPYAEIDAGMKKLIRKFPFETLQNSPVTAGE